MLEKIKAIKILKEEVDLNTKWGVGVCIEFADGRDAIRGGRFLNKENCDPLVERQLIFDILNNALDAI